MDTPTTLRTTSGRLTKVVMQFTTRSPWAALGTAAALGYIVGGGLFTPLTSRLWRTGLVLATIPQVRTRMLAMFEAAMGAAMKPAVESE